MAKEHVFGLIKQLGDAAAMKVAGFVLDRGVETIDDLARYSPGQLTHAKVGKPNVDQVARLLEGYGLSFADKPYKAPTPPRTVRKKPVRAGGSSPVPELEVSRSLEGRTQFYEAASSTTPTTARP
ncbi:hypothetical protein HOD38_00395 [archaeon]|nr:hypothetical protein [archaeon]MBT4396706.1 hypothetical protein [archaeon]MBT4441316.1 hypothetical protein [archaeon]